MGWLTRHKGEIDKAKGMFHKAIDLGEKKNRYSNTKRLFFDITRNHGTVLTLKPFGHSICGSNGLSRDFVILRMWHQDDQQPIHRLLELVVRWLNNWKSSALPLYGHNGKSGALKCPSLDWLARLPGRRWIDGEQEVRVLFLPSYPAATISFPATFLTYKLRPHVAAERSILIAGR